MTDKQINLLINIMYSIASIAVLIGAIFKISHYPYGLAILLLGFMLGTAISIFDNIRLNKKIKSLEEQIENK